MLSRPTTSIWRKNTRLTTRRNHARTRYATAVIVVRTSGPHGAVGRSAGRRAHHAGREVGARPQGGERVRATHDASVDLRHHERDREHLEVRLPADRTLVRRGWPWCIGIRIERVGIREHLAHERIDARL